MGWCSATGIFDDICSAIFDKDGYIEIEDVIKTLIEVLELNDWDCQTDSEFYDHPVVNKVLRALHPEWFEKEDDEEFAKTYLVDTGYIEEGTYD